jgi:branched-chain amino acid transport system substrate-binding protein
MRKLALVLAVLLAVIFFTNSPVLAKTIKIGLLQSLSGVYSDAGAQNKNGFLLKMKEAGFKIGKHEIKVIVEDTETKPAVAVTKARKLVEKDGVDMTTGCYFSSEGLAVRDFIHEAKIPHIVQGGCTTLPLSYEKKSPYFWRCSSSAGQYELGWAEYSCSVGLKNVVVLAPDYSYGHDMVKFFTKDFKNHGGQVIQSVLVPFPTLDFAPYLSKIDPKAQAILSVHAGADSVRLVKQFKSYGMWKKMALTGGALIMQELLEAEGDDALGIMGAMFYSTEIDTPENKRYVKAYMDEYKELPGSLSPCAYEAATVFLTAFKELEGEIDNFPNQQAFREAFLKAAAKVNFVSPRGPFRFEQETNSAVHNTYVLKAVKKDGKMVLQVLKTIPGTRPSQVKALLSD